MKSRFSIPELVLSLMLLVPTTVNGQGAVEPEPESVVDGLLAEGVALRRAGDDEAAIERFRAATELGRQPRALAQLGLAEHAVGRFVDAAEHLSEALATSDPWVEEHRATLEEDLAVVMEHVGSIEVLVDVEGAQVFVDGESVAPPVFRLTGTYVVDVEADGYAGFRNPSVVVEAGQVTRVDVRLEAISSPEPAPEPVSVEADPVEENDRAPAPSSAWPAVAIASGIATGLLAGGALAATIVREVNVLDHNRCVSAPEEPAGGCHFRSTFETAEGVAIAGWVAAGAAAVLMTVAIVVALGEGDEVEARLSPSGVHLAGRF